jgi:hypothetical protein
MAAPTRVSLDEESTMLRRHALALGIAVTFATSARADPPPYYAVWSPTAPGIGYGFAASLTRSAGSPDALQDFTVGAQLTARNAAGVNQWAFGAATEAWALPGSRSLLIGVEAAVINEEPANQYPKIALSAVMKNRADGGVDPGAPLNASSIAYWVSAQPGTGFERGLVFDRDSLAKPGSRPAAIDLSDIPDDKIGQIDLIRIRKGVSLRYDPASRSLVLYVEPDAATGAPQPRSSLNVQREP